MIYEPDEMFDDQPTGGPYYYGDVYDDYDDEGLELLGDEVYDQLVDMGYNPELMGGPFKKLFRKIKRRIKSRRSKRAKRKALAELSPEAPLPNVPPEFQIMTPQGGVTYGPGGLNVLRQQGAISPVAQQQMQASQAGFNPMAMIQKQPMLLAIPFGLMMMMMMMKKRRGGGGSNGKK